MALLNRTGKKTAFASLIGFLAGLAGLAVAQPKSNVSAGTATRFTGVCPTGKGAEKVWEVSVSPVYHASGERFRILSIARDITECTATARQLAEARKKLARSNEDLERFASVATHELKPPVNTIVALSQMLRTAVVLWKIQNCYSSRPLSSRRVNGQARSLGIP